MKNKDYRKIWEEFYDRTIPDGHEIHHIDGNHKNNNPDNLLCVTPEEHYEIHYQQDDFLACALIALRIGVDLEERKRLHKLAMIDRDMSGEKNPMFGRSAIKENNMRWYTNGTEDKMFVENEQPDNWYLGRPSIVAGQYNKSGSNNPRARRVRANGIVYNCIKEAAEALEINYYSLKSILANGGSKKYDIEITYENL